MDHDGQQAERGLRRHGRTLAGTLWFPAAFFFGFLLCYLLPFHSPSPHHVEVAVAPPAVAQSLSREFAARSPGSFDLVAAPDAAAVRRLVLDRRVVAGYSATGTGGDLYVAQAGGAELEQVVSAAFTPVAARGGPRGHGGVLHTIDLVPPAPGDQTGTGLFYLCLPWTLVPYILVMMLGRASRPAGSAADRGPAGAGVRSGSGPGGPAGRAPGPAGLRPRAPAVHHLRAEAGTAQP